jgi:sulfur carrier protein
MKVKVNGKDVIFEQEVNVNEFLEVQKVEMKDYVTVQINDELMDRDDFEYTIVRDGDIVEFLYFMGGGTL